ncbi:hypothetical protein SFRURICE_004929 [Spodoptera frugiperda]|nr:hypothetical protein SFRURICE_004929 [Spodoptera frugiperda]
MVRKLKFHEQKLLKKVDFISWKVDNNLNEVKVMKKYHIQKREDYTKYNKLSREIRELANKIKDLDASNEFRTESSAQLLEKLYQMGLIPTRWDLALATNVSASSFCRRRLPSVMVRNKMSENMKEATKYIEQGHVRVGPEVVKDPAFLVTRALEDFVTWVDGSAIRRHVMEYNDLRDDFEMLEKENCSRKINGNIPALSINSDNMSTSTDSDDVADPTYEIRNIQSIINVTRENIDALNAKFAGFQHPPSLYLSEYQELTSKLHNLELRERTLRELLQCESPDRSEEYSIQDDSKKFDTLTRQPKVFLRAHLPNQQRTSVQVKEGVTLRDALSKALKLRNLTCEMCEVVRTGNDLVIPWDIDITMIDAEEVTVRTLDKLPIMSHISHQFTRKTFFTLAFCECCRRLLFNGFYCSQCNFKFHQRCADKVPSICHQVRMTDTYYAALLAQNPETQAGILHFPPHFGYHHMISRTDQSKHQHPRSLNQQDRSNSAPNVCINMVQRPMTLAEHQRKHNQGSNNSPQSSNYLTSGRHKQDDKDKAVDQQHSQSTQASPTGTLRPRRARARSADESWKNALSPRESYDDWVIHADEILIGARIDDWSVKIGDFGLATAKVRWSASQCPTSGTRRGC